MKKKETPVFKDHNEYINFAVKYNTYGKDAIKLKESMDKQK